MQVSLLNGASSAPRLCPAEKRTPYPRLEDVLRHLDLRYSLHWPNGTLAPRHGVIA